MEISCYQWIQGVLNQTLWLSFAATPAATASRFDVDERFVAYLAVLCNAVYVPGSWLCTWLLRSHGLAKVEQSSGAQIDLNKAKSV